MTSSRPWPSRKACAAAPTRAAPPSPPPRRTNGSARPSSASAPARAGPADREGARDDVRDDDGTDSDRTGRDRKEGGAQADGGKPERKGPSLKMRAVGYLSRREHARAELAASWRLMPRIRPRSRRCWTRWKRKAGCPPSVSLRASCIGARRARGARIVQELRQHGVDDGQVAELRDQLRSTEHERALEVWRKRFGEKPADRAAYAKQARFLASRGFAQDVIRRILGGAGDEE